MDSKNMVSVLMPCYNHEKYILEAIESIIAQTYKNIELIVVDDGSKDNSWDVISKVKDKCKKRFSSVIFETKANEGACSTFNRCAELASGEYIYIIASDDKAAPNAIETLHRFLSKNREYGLAVGENLLMDGQSKQCYWDKNCNTVYEEDAAEYKSFSDMLKKNNPAIDFLSSEFGSYKSFLGTNYVPNGYLIRKSIFDKTGGYSKEAPLEDWYLMLQLSKYCKFKFINKPLFYYRWHDTNTVKQREKIDDFFFKTFDYEVKLVEKCGDERIKKIMYEHLHGIQRKVIFKIKPILELFKIRDYEYKKTIISFFGHDFILKQKANKK